MDKAVVGIDIAKDSFDAILKTDTQRHANFKNTPEGYEKLMKWVSKYSSGPVHACMEATGQYGDELAEYIHERGWMVSIVNPKRIKAYAESQLRRNKTDKLDAALIVEFCARQEPALWSPPPANIKALQELMRRREDLMDMLHQEKNRLKAGKLNAQVQDSLEKHIAYLEARLKEIEEEIDHLVHDDPDLKQQKDLITSIKGIGDITAYMLLSEIPHLRDYTNVNELVAFCGLNPRQHRSGSSINGKPRLSKTGSSRIRKALYFPAVVAKTRNPIMVAFAEGMASRGKPTMCIIGAIMRKLLHLVYGILKSGKPFDPDFGRKSLATS